MGAHPALTIRDLRVRAARVAFVQAEYGDDPAVADVMHFDLPADPA